MPSAAWLQAPDAIMLSVEHSNLVQQQDVEGVASVAGGPGTVSAGNEYDSDEWADEETTDAGMFSEDMAEEMEVAGGYPGQGSGGQSYAEEDDYEG